MATISDIAKAAGVSRATVSYVMNNRHDKMAQDTRHRVLEVMRTLNYTPSALARGLNGKAVNTLGVVILAWAGSPFDNPYYRPILSGIMDEGTERRLSVNLFHGPHWFGENDAVPAFCDGRCDGFLIFLPKIGSRVLDALLGQPTPFVIIGERGENPLVSSVDIDNVAVARDMTRQLIQRGHRRIAHIEGDIALKSTYDRVKGYREALEEAGIPFDPALVYRGGYSMEEGRAKSALMFRDLDCAPTAVFAGADATAYGLIEGVRELGLRVPEDVSVVGIDGVQPLKDYGLQLTTADQKLRLLGQNAAKLLIERMENPELAPAKILQPYEVVTGNSVAAPRGAAGKGR